MYVIQLVGIFMWIKLSVELLLSDGCKPAEPEYLRYTVKNLIREPTFTHSMNISIVGCGTTTPVTKYMELACDQNKQLFPNFSQTYFPGLGFYVSALNGVEEIAGETYWEFIEHVHGTQFSVGPSNYIPKSGDHIGWNLTEISSFSRR